MTYTFTYDGSSRPKWEKTFTASNDESFSVLLTYENEEDRLQLTKEQTFGYMDMLLQYAKDVLCAFSLIQIDENEAPKGPYPVRGEYQEYEWAMQSLNTWWFWGFFNDDYEVDRQPVEGETE